MFDSGRLFVGFGEGSTSNVPVVFLGVVLLPGRYTFEAGNWATSPDIVRVTSVDHQKLYFVGFTQLVRRPTGIAPTEIVSIGEAPAGTPAPIRAWYPTGSSAGHEFRDR